MNLIKLSFIPLLPLLGFLLNGIFALRSSRSEKSNFEKPVRLLGVLLPLLAFGGSAWLSWPYLFEGVEAPTIEHLFTWISTPSLQIDFSLRLDKLSALMMLIITGVGSLIHLYSVGYMKGDKGVARYFAFLNLFVAMMLILVMADNLVVMFLGWEGVGLCSYFLIGFWFQDPENAKAGKKAFLVNRIGDAAFLVALFLISLALLPAFSAPVADLPFSIFSFQLLESFQGNYGSLTGIILLLLFIGAIGKSAQIPLHIWLPDAMAGPTPVSALIHAATMVTAGVYLMVRLSPLYGSAPWVPKFIAGVGAITALISATSAIVQTDIKKVLAYSTLSQLGYLFMAVGIGANAAAMFHLLTHAFFKAALFLGAGAVIHALHGEQDLTQMGALRRKIPFIFLVMLLATFALAGIPPFAGFFSKDEILWQLYHHNHKIFWGLGMLTAGLTAFYAFRLLALIFLGSARSAAHQEIHKPGLTMNLPLLLLALLSLCGGWIGISHAFGGGAWFFSWLGPASEVADSLTTERILAGVNAGWALLWGGIACFLYSKKGATMESLSLRSLGMRRLLFQNYYFNQFYEKGIIAPLLFLSRFLLGRGVEPLIDRGLVEGSASFVQGVGKWIGRLQTGLVNHYALYFLISILALLFWFIGIR